MWTNMRWLETRFYPVGIVSVHSSNVIYKASLMISSLHFVTETAPSLLICRIMTNPYRWCPEESCHRIFSG